MRSDSCSSELRHCGGFHDRRRNPQPPASAPLLVNLLEAARLLGTTPWRIRKLVWSGQLKPIRLDTRKYLFAVKDLEDYIEKLRRIVLEGRNMGDPADLPSEKRSIRNKVSPGMSRRGEAPGKGSRFRKSRS